MIFPLVVFLFLPLPFWRNDLFSKSIVNPDWSLFSIFFFKEIFKNFCLNYRVTWAPLLARTVKNPPEMWETWVWSLGGEDPWRRAWQPTPVFLPAESPWTEEPGGLQSMGSQRVGHDWVTNQSTQTQHSTSEKPYSHLSRGRGSFGEKSSICFWLKKKIS